MRFRRKEKRKLGKRRGSTVAACRDPLIKETISAEERNCCFGSRHAATVQHWRPINGRGWFSGRRLLLNSSLWDTRFSRIRAFPAPWKTSFQRIRAFPAPWKASFQRIRTFPAPWKARLPQKLSSASAWKGAHATRRNSPHVDGVKLGAIHRLQRTLKASSLFYPSPLPLSTAPLRIKTCIFAALKSVASCPPYTIPKERREATNEDTNN